MANDVTLVSKAERMLAEAKTPKQSKSVEAVASAAMAWAREQEDYEVLIGATRIYVLARRKTTELIAPEIVHGDHGVNQHVRVNTDVNSLPTVEDFGFTNMQWSRRLAELEIAPEDIDSYFDVCIANRWDPSVGGMVRYYAGPAGQTRRTSKSKKVGAFSWMKQETEEMWKTAQTNIGICRAAWFNAKQDPTVAHHLLANRGMLLIKTGRSMLSDAKEKNKEYEFFNKSEKKWLLTFAREVIAELGGTQ
jgi:hypothetical protein